ncbi:hypothetical protein CHUAL_003890 [Chamberlinius hualienensis]
MTDILLMSETEYDTKTFDAFPMTNRSHFALENAPGVIVCGRSFNNTTSCYVNISRPDDPDYSDGLAMEHIISIVVPILFGLVVFVGLIGNALVVVVVACNQQMRNTTNILIINLAVADLLFIIFCVPFTATDYALRVWPFGDAWCKVVQYLIIVCAYASVYTLMLMSLDRFLAVVFPINSMSIRTDRNTYWAIFVLWFVILVFCTPAMLSHGEVPYIYAEQIQTGCVFLTEIHNLAAFQITFFLTSYVIPLTLICVLYLAMLKRLWHGVVPGGHCSVESLRGKKRVTRLVIVVVVIFAVCWGPIQIVLVLKSLDSYQLNEKTIAIQITSHVLAYVNSCVNPILYAFLSENFRKAFRKLIACQSARTVNARANGERSETRAMITRTTRLNNDTDII